MSSVVTTPPPITPGPDPAASPAPPAFARVNIDAALALGLAAGVVAVTFLLKATPDGNNLAAGTWVEIALVLVGAGLVVAAVLAGARWQRWGLLSVALFAALVMLTFVSIAWSVQPDASWLEGNRALSYLAAFVGAMALARIAPRRWPALIGAIAIAATVVSGWALLAKVFPGTLDASDPYGRLSVPFGYWNALGLAAAIGLPACLWAGGRRESARILRTLAVPALAILITTLVLSYGRGALAAAVIGLAFWFAAVPFRLRAAVLLLLATVGAAVPSIWAIASRALTHDKIALASRVSAGRTFGVVLVLTLLALSAAGYVASTAVDRRTPSPDLRRRVVIAFVAVAALIPVGGVVALAASSRGLTGEISHAWNSLTTDAAHPGDTSGRLVRLGSSRPVYWREGLLVGEHAAFKGVGAGGFQVASLRYAKNRWGVAAQAHSYVVQTFADFGVLGLLVSLALLAVWARAARAAVGLRAARAGPEHTVERAGMMTLLAVVVIFGLHSAIDWTWLVPGVALPALACAGWLAGRGSLALMPERLRGLRGPATAPGAAGAATAIAAVALIGAWAIWQPLRAANANSAALAALAKGDIAVAFTDARSAAAYDPESTAPLTTLSDLYSAVGDPARARLELRRATSLQPDDPDTWEQLGEFEFYVRHDGRAALGPLRHALTLDPSAQSIHNDIANASS